MSRYDAPQPPALLVRLTKGNDGYSDYVVSLFPCRTEGTFIEYLE